jgi:hypothetical protein
VEVASGGAHNETVAVALLLAEASQTGGSDGTLLARIAADESRHAALAWDTLAWGWPQLTDTERTRVRRALLRPLQAAPVLGALSVAEVREVVRSAQDQVVEPLWQRLIA